MIVGTATGLGAVTVGIADSTTTQEQLLSFNVLILDSATVATALESVTATVIDLFVYWKPGFRIKLEALFSSRGRNTRLGSDDSITSEIGCFDIDSVNRLVLVGFEFDLTVVGFNTLNAWIQLKTLAVGSVKSKAINFKGLGLESVTAAMIDLYVERKQDFERRLEAALIGFNDLTTWQQMGNLELLDSTPVVLGINDSMTQ